MDNPCCTSYKEGTKSCSTTVIDFKILLFYLWHGKYVYVVAQVNPGKTTELGIFEGFSQIFKDAKSQTVPIESQCCEFGQCTQEGQK